MRYLRYSMCKGGGQRTTTHDLDCGADPYENGTPTWGSSGTPEVRAKKSTKLSCSFDDSVEWLRPKQAAMSKTTTRAEDLRQQASSATFWCPFARKREADEYVVPSR